ncbi:MAG: flippase activity-associated protein Agl23, partial [Anaerolineae bacterium]
LSLDWEKAIYIVFILAAILSRFWGLGSRVMSHDESLHTQFSYQFYNGDGYQHTPLMHGAFLFHITALSYWLFGDGDLSARIPVAIFGVILVAVPYLLRRWIGRVGALFASLVLLISPYVTYYSRYIRHDVYVIIFALIVFIASWYYLHERKDKYLWWFAGGTAMMFATKEVAFIYVAIFGSWLVIRLLAKLAAAPWLRKTLPDLRLPILVTLIAVLMIGGGFMAQRSLQVVEERSTTTQATDEGFAADPNQATAVPEPSSVSKSEQFMRWLQIAGFGVLALGLFLAARTMRPHIDEYAEFDLIVLYTALILPTVSPFLVTLAGWNPRDYTMSTCVLKGQETMSALQIFMGRLSSAECRSAFLDSGVVHSGSFLIVTLALGAALGLWWHNRKFLTIFVIFQALFAFFYTSVFTNPTGWTSGMIGSLGYWLKQQEVQRGSQPWFYYFFVMPFYEFLPLIFSTLAMGLWLKTKRVGQIVGYWLGVLLLAGLVYSLSFWFFNRPLLQAGEEPSNAVAGILTAVILGAGILFWYFVRAGQIKKKLDVDSLSRLWRLEWLDELMPAMIWWLLLTWVAYSYAGEKMPWLSIHFVIPMAFMVGWYFQNRVRETDWPALLARPFLTLTGLRMAAIIAVFLAVGPVFLGQIRFGDQQISSLNGMGRFLGSTLVAVGLMVLWRRQFLQMDTAVARLNRPFAIFGLLALLTIRFTYMANFPNADYTNEFLNYAHGAPATKNMVMRQVEELSMRLYGDKSIKVAFSQDTSWPFTWYLRDYPNRNYFGDAPSNALNESPIILVGSLDWAKVEPYLGNNYESRTYTYLWWPMEEYRKIWESPNDL